MKKPIPPAVIGIVIALIVVVLVVVGARMFSGSSDEAHPGDGKALPGAFRSGTARPK